MDSGQRALLKYWRDEGIITEDKPPKLIGDDGNLLGPRTWTFFFQTMDAFNHTAFYFKVDMYFRVILPGLDTYEETWETLTPFSSP